MKKLLPLVVVVVLIGAGIAALYNVGRNKGYSPDQPIPFSHERHVTQNGIPCMYCHTGVEKTKHATVPAMNVCMNCHSVVLPDSPHIKRLKEAYASGKPIEWVKIHDLPDHVNFNHKRHVAKGIACETCHGDVGQMVKVKQVVDMNMGWCLDCHRGKTTPPEVVSAITKEKAADPVKASMLGTAVAPTNCYTCHH
ncbi:MAG TPA: cytochrome c3 family protein [Oligoflexia bacterium]|nr:cytochrome c3 family protein [Oligoflexia bacterium]